MRCGIVLAAALIATPFTAISFTIMSATAAHAEQWCGFPAGPHPMVQCGYSTLESCENNAGKGATCFVNPSVAINDGRTTPADSLTPTARKG
jgi:hypothetical protein